MRSGPAQAVASTPAISSPDRRSIVGFRMTPQDNSFYDLFAKSASFLVDGARELTTILGVEPSEREAVAARMLTPSTALKEP